MNFTRKLKIQGIKKNIIGKKVAFFFQLFNFYLNLTRWQVKIWEGNLAASDLKKQASSRTLLLHHRQFWFCKQSDFDPILPHSGTRFEFLLLLLLLPNGFRTGSPTTNPFDERSRRSSTSEKWVLRDLTSIFMDKRTTKKVDSAEFLWKISYGFLQQGLK